MIQKGQNKKKKVSEENDVSAHETKISVAVIPLKKKEEVEAKSRKHKRKLDDLQAGVKYHKIYHTKKASLMMKESEAMVL